jgi:hypothetical protein
MRISKSAFGIRTRVKRIRVGRWISLSVSVLLLVLSYIAVVVLTQWVR